jgi:hypothetical protein
MQPFGEPHERERERGEGWHMRGRGEESSSKELPQFHLCQTLL